MIKRIIFDIDNTLIDRSKEYQEAYKVLLNKFKISKTPEELYSTIGKYQIKYNSVYYTEEKLLEVINKEFGTNLEMNFINDLFNVYDNLPICVSDEIKDTLEYLSSKYELFALSNWFTESQKRRLEKVDILKYFKGVYGTDIVPMKPLKESYMSVIGDLDVSECVMIGDSIDMDIKVPYEMGMNVYHLSKNGTSEYPTIRKIEELKEML